MMIIHCIHLLRSSCDFANLLLPEALDIFECQFTKHRRRSAYSFLVLCISNAREDYWLAEIGGYQIGHTRRGRQKGVRGQPQTRSSTSQSASAMCAHSSRTQHPPQHDLVTLPVTHRFAKVRAQWHWSQAGMGPSGGRPGSGAVRGREDGVPPWLPHLPHHQGSAARRRLLPGSPSHPHLRPALTRFRLARTGTWASSASRWSPSPAALSASPSRARSSAGPTPSTRSPPSFPSLSLTGRIWVQEACLGHKWLGGVNAFVLNEDYNSMLSGVAHYQRPTLQRQRLGGSRLQPICCESPDVRLDLANCRPLLLNGIRLPFDKAIQVASDFRAPCLVY